MKDKIIYFVPNKQKMCQTKNDMKKEYELYKKEYKE